VNPATNWIERILRALGILPSPREPRSETRRRPSRFYISADTPSTHKAVIGERGLKLMLKVNTDRGEAALLKATPASDAAAEKLVDGRIAWSADNGDIAIAPSEDGGSAIVTAPQSYAGKATVTASADADLGEGVETVIGVFELVFAPDRATHIVIAGEIVKATADETASALPAEAAANDAPSAGEADPAQAA
jgi:hypothetical protein